MDAPAPTRLCAWLRLMTPVALTISARWASTRKTSGQSRANQEVL